MAVNKTGGVHFFGVFRDEAVDDKIVVVGAFEINFRGGSRGGVGLGDDARDAPNCGLRLRKTDECADFV